MNATKPPVCGQKYVHLAVQRFAAPIGRLGNPEREIFVDLSQAVRTNVNGHKKARPLAGLGGWGICDVILLTSL